MKCLRYADSRKSIEEAFLMRDQLTEEFGEDLPVVSARYFMQLADLCYVTQKYQECMDAAIKGIEQVQLAAKSDEDIAAHLNNTRRDLINLKLRAAKKINPLLDLTALRIEEGKKYGFDQTLLPSEPLREIEKVQMKLEQSVKSEAPSEESESDSEEEPGFSYSSASLVAGVVSLSAAALTYMAVSK